METNLTFDCDPNSNLKGKKNENKRKKEEETFSMGSSTVSPRGF